MKILFLCRLLYPHVGGVEKHVMEISRRLVAQGHSVSVITERHDASLPLQEKQNGIDIYRMPVGKEDKRKKFRIWHEMWRLHNVIKNADIVHCHDVFFWYLPFRALYPKKPVYTTFHGYESFPISKKAIQMRKMAEKLSWGNLCIGDFIKKWYGTKPTYVSYGAVDSAKGKVQSEKFKEESAVFVGRLDEQTGILTYVGAVEILKEKFPKFQFAVVGDGAYREKIERDVCVLGWKTDPEIYIYQYHFAFVSRYLTILEAFAAKKLVFAVYDNLVKDDYLRMTPFVKWIVIEDDAEKLAEKVKYYLENPKEGNTMITAAHDWASKQTWERMVDLYLTLWKK